MPRPAAPTTTSLAHFVPSFCKCNDLFLSLEAQGASDILCHQSVPLAQRLRPQLPLTNVPAQGRLVTNPAASQASTISKRPSLQFLEAASIAARVTERCTRPHPVVFQKIAHLRPSIAHAHAHAHTHTLDNGCQHPHTYAIPPSCSLKPPFLPARKCALLAANKKMPTRDQIRLACIRMKATTLAFCYSALFIVRS
ncbi:hypothetical protein J3E74DRAFT_288216 [Bipolaris maydis]|nr:hypothetical protein J3E74DRAFT_288216 [Bipolaris maydis]